MSNPLGLNVPNNESTRSVLGEVVRTISGNVALRIGHTYEDSPGWEQTEYVVLDRDEAQALVERLQEALAEHTRYLVVGGSGDLQRLQAYLYSQDKVLSHAPDVSLVDVDEAAGAHPRAAVSSRIVAVVQVTGSDEDNAAYRGQYVTGRLESGGYGVTLHETVDEANAESVLRRVLLGV